MGPLFGFVCVLACVLLCLCVCFFGFLLVGSFVGLFVWLLVCWCVCLFVCSFGCSFVCSFVSLFLWLVVCTWKGFPKHISKGTRRGISLSQRDLKKKKNTFPRWHFSFYVFGSKIAPRDFGFEKNSQAKKARDCLGGPSVVFSNKNAKLLEGKKKAKQRITTWS